MTTIYFASKLRHAPTFRAWYHELIDSPRFDVVSTWHNSPTIEADERDAKLCRDGWRENLRQIEDSECMIAYATAADPIQGTLVEIGAMLACGGEVYLVGDYPWGSWQHHPEVTTHCRTVHAALSHIAGDLIPLPARESLLYDPT